MITVDPPTSHGRDADGAAHEQTFTKGPYNNSTAGAQVGSPYDYFRVARSKSSEISKMKPTKSPRRDDSFSLLLLLPLTSAPITPQCPRGAQAPAETRIIILATSPSSTPTQSPSPTPASSSFPDARALMNSCRSRHLTWGRVGPRDVQHLHSKKRILPTLPSIFPVLFLETGWLPIPRRESGVRGAVGTGGFH